MYKYILVVLFCILTNISKAQTDFFFKWDDKTDVYLMTSLIDKDDNLYLLGAFTRYFAGILPIDGDFYTDNLIIKIDKYNNIIYKKLIKRSGYTIYRDMFLVQDNLFCPYNLDTSLCVIAQGYHSIPVTSAINAGALINKNTGEPLKSFVFYDGKHCGSNYNVYCNFVNNKIHFYYVNDSAPGFYPLWYEQVIGSNYNVLVDHLLDPINKINQTGINEAFRVFYDSITGNCIVDHLQGINIYNNQWQLINAIDFHSYIPTFRGISVSCITYNENYYAINFKTYTYYDPVTNINHYTYNTLILTKDGQLVTCKESLNFNDMILTKDNHLFGISTIDNTVYYPNSDTNVLSLTLIEMDMYQNLERKLSFGLPYITASKIMITSDNDVIVTGTLLTDRERKKPTPNKAYYYKKSLDEIPLLIKDTDLCHTINIYPNPARTTVTLTGMDFNMEHNAQLELYNSYGQQLYKDTWVKKDYYLNISQYPDGMYYLKIRNSNTSCMEKVIKQ